METLLILYPNIIENQLDQQANNVDSVWIFKGIKSHHGPITSNNPDYIGSSYNILVEWEDCSETLEPLDSVTKDDPISVANYAMRTTSSTLLDGNIPNALKLIQMY
jgi:hypothetical protein